MSNLKDAPLYLQRPSTVRALVDGMHNSGLAALPVEPVELVDACPTPAAKTEKRP